MPGKKKSNAIVPMFIFFIVVNAFCLLFKDWLDAKKIDHLVVMGANCILFLLSSIVFLMHRKAVGNKNPHAFVRSVMAGTFIKLVVVAGTVVAYVMIVEQDKSNYAIIAGIGLYFVYTFIEVKSAARLNREHGGN
jgi:heme/copper-type cytochrome/quinol oxidase subunit 3